jgi:hypothetical protein
MSPRKKPAPRPTSHPEAPPAITPVEFDARDHERAEDLARRLGYEQTAYTSSSALWGLFCSKENPATWRGKPRAIEGGCIIKTREFGLLFVQDLEDLNAHDLHARYMEDRNR